MALDTHCNDFELARGLINKNLKKNGEAPAIKRQDPQSSRNSDSYRDQAAKPGLGWWITDSTRWGRVDGTRVPAVVSGLTSVTHLNDDGDGEGDPKSETTTHYETTGAVRRKD